jgi:hypothetical protein
MRPPYREIQYGEDDQDHDSSLQSQPQLTEPQTQCPITMIAPSRWIIFIGGSDPGLSHLRTLLDCRHAAYSGIDIFPIGFDGLVTDGDDCLELTISPHFRHNLFCCHLD